MCVAAVVPISYFWNLYGTSPWPHLGIGNRLEVVLHNLYHPYHGVVHTVTGTELVLAFIQCRPECHPLRYNLQLGGVGIVILNVFVKKSNRNKGFFKKMLAIIRQAGFRFIVLEYVVNQPLLNKCLSDEYGFVLMDQEFSDWEGNRSIVKILD